MAGDDPADRVKATSNAEEKATTVKRARAFKLPFSSVLQNVRGRLYASVAIATREAGAAITLRIA